MQMKNKREQQRKTASLSGEKKVETENKVERKMSEKKEKNKEVKKQVKSEKKSEKDSGKDECPLVKRKESLLLERRVDGEETL